MNTLYRITISLATVLISTIMPAADLPQLPVASSIKTGTLDNGIAYYLVTNSTEKGKADVALVRRGGYDMESGVESGSSAVNVMGSLAGLPHFRTDTPFSYLSRNCIWPGPGGYASVYSDATIYRFGGLDLTRSKEVVDSTLLMVFDIVGRQSERGDRYSPDNQAIVVSGDIDAGAVLNKMNMLSMLVTRHSSEKQVDRYAWNVSDDVVYRHIQSDIPGIVSLTAEYKSPRTPLKNMNTIQPLVSRKFAMEFGIIMKKRLSTALRQAGIPVGGVNADYSGSQSGPGDETYRITVTTSIPNLNKATAVLSGVLADLNKNGVSPDEYRDTENELVMNLKREYSGDVTANSIYVEQCISAYLYGASLTSAATNMNFFLEKNIQDDLGAKLFNNFIFALLDRSKNLTVECKADSLAVSGRDVLENFSAAWSAGNMRTYNISNSDTLTLKKPSGKLKIKTVSPEPLSGGQIWTFDNGIRVIFKNVPKSGMFHYMWLLKGGYSLLPGIKPGESAYISDMLRLYDVCGMSCYRFADMLSANGITMKGEVTMSDFRISGAAPSSRLRLVMKAMASFADNKSLNKDAYDYYRKCQDLMMAAGSSQEAVLDSLMFPGNVWSPYKRRIKLTDDFPKRASKFFDSEFSKMNDGVLVIVGDLDEFSLKKDLCRDLGNFSTEKVSSFRSRLQYESVSGRVSEIKRGDKPELSVGISSPLMFTSANFMASQIAAMVMTDKLSATLSKCGWYGSPSWEFAMFPEERFNFRMNCAMSDRTGIPASLAQTDSVEFVMSALRRTVSQVSDGISADEMSVYRSMLLKSMEARMSDPETIMSMLVLRYSYGKDMVTKYKDKVNAVTLDNVNEVLAAMAKGRLAEYAVRRSHEGEQIHEQKLKKPVFEGIIPVLLPAADSSGVNAAAYGVLGLSAPAVPDWGDSAVFRRRLKEFPAPRVIKVSELDVKVAKDSLIVKDTLTNLSASDSLKVRVDSLTAVPDSVAVCPVDTTETVFHIEN